jgi:hypothetical protein
MSEHDFPNPMRESEERAATADALRLSSAHWSWRSVETVGRNAKAAIARDHIKALANDAQCLDGNHGRQYAGEERMQRTAMVTKVSGLIAVPMGAALITWVVRVLVMDV